MQQHLSWQETINRALSVHTDIPSSRFLQLATVDIHGQPHCRTLVFRGFDPVSYTHLTLPTTPYV